ncbi:MAG TPA: triple tyrosine motif-containing protein [Bacteroidia bacterium]|nr:triple tyrosine motif-containing protein [Bacteroidia bacterium]
MRHCFLFILLLFFFFNGISQPLRFTHFGPDEGLSSNVIHQMICDSHGFLWLATEKGIQRFDGTTFRSFQKENGCIPGDTVYSIHSASSGKLVAGTSGGLVLFDYTGKFQFNELPEAVSRPGEPVRTLASLPGKSLWLCTSKILAALDDKAKVQQLFTLNDLQQNQGNFISDIRGFVLDKNNNAWIVLNGKLFILKRDTRDFVAWNREGTAVPYFTSVAMDTEASVWAHAVFDTQDSLLRFSENNLVNFSFPVRTAQDKDIQISFLHDGRICLATSSRGLIIADSKKQRTHSFIANSSDEKAVSGDKILSVYEDPNQLLWIATPEALNKSSVLSTDFKYIFYSGSADSRKFDAPDILDAVLLNDSTALLSSNSGLGLVKVDLLSGNSTVLFPPGHPNHVSHTLHICKLTDHEWIISSLSGNLIFDDIKEKLRPLSSLPSCPEILKQPVAILAMYRDRAERIWISVVNVSGVFCFHPEEKKWNYYSSSQPEPAYFPLRTFTCATEDKEGNIWFGNDNGVSLTVFDQQQQKFGIPSKSTENVQLNRILDLATDSAGKIWIGSASGLTYYDPQRNQFFSALNIKETHSNTIRRIVCTENKNLWITTNSGLIKYEQTKDKFTEFSEEDGLIETTFNSGALYNYHSKTIVCTTENGIVSFHALKEKQALSIPPPVVLNARINGEENFISNTGFRLSHLENNISIQFTCPVLHGPENIVYEFRLSGFDPDWVKAGKLKEAQYRQLPPGNYSFQLRASSDGIHWMEAKSPVPFTIAIPFYKSPVFLTLALIVLVSLAFGVYILRQRARLHQTILAHDLRNNISRDLHDDIGSAISSIALMSELAARLPSGHTSAYLEKISETARGLIENMNDIIWVINPGNDKLESVNARMRRFGSTILEAKNIVFEFEGDDELEKIQLPMNVRRNLYLVFKELVNNAAKHSQCTRLKVSFRRENSGINLCIEDNGKGFDTAAFHDGNGIKNIQSRCREIGGRLDFTSLPGQGTRFEISLTEIK